MQKRIIETAPVVVVGFFLFNKNFSQNQVDIIYNWIKNYYYNGEILFIQLQTGK